MHEIIIPSVNPPHPPLSPRYAGGEGKMTK